MWNKHLKLMIFAAIAALFTGSVVSATEMDERIESAVKQSYVFKTYFKDDKIAAQSKDGVVTLKGTVMEGSHISLAQETVSYLPGVKAVDNQLVLKGESPGEHSDNSISMRVKTVLLFHRKANAFKTEVIVKDGVVTLYGKTSSQAQKDLIGEYAKDVEDVKYVKNEMTVEKAVDDSQRTVSEIIDDASITAQVKMALLTHRSTRTIRASVATVSGVSTVSGTVKNEAEKELIGKYVEDINGVTGVVNNMIVENPSK